MPASEWESIKTVFEAALSAAPEEREAYLDAACAGNPELRQAVARLIENHLGAGDFLAERSVPVRHVFSTGDLVAGRFRITRFISSGGMGEVYEAYDEKLRLRLALKTLRPQLAAETQALERFQREIRIAREVSHESLCRVYDLVEHVDASAGAAKVASCLTMQLLEGESLQAYLSRQRPLTPAAALPLVRQIALAIQALHDRGIVHRDLKPSNIILTNKGDGSLLAVVTDFGLAKPVEGETEFFESHVDFQAGAPYFMAPELLRGDRPSIASDIYALGLVIDEMVTRSRAYPADSVQSLYYQKLREAPIPPSARSEGLPPNWELVILRCLEAEPERRYASAAAVVAALDVPGAAAVTEETAGPAVRGQGIRRWLMPPLGRRAAVFALGAITAFAILAFVRLSLQPMNTSVLVFPIDTNQPEYNYLCKGTTAEVMRRLTLIEGVRIIPYYDSRSTAPRHPANARFSLAGMLQVSNDRVRLTAQLTDNRDDALVWSQNFERKMSDTLDLQSDIAEGAVRALEARTFLRGPPALSHAGAYFARPLRELLGLQIAAVPRPATTSPVAFEYYIRGVDLLEERNLPGAQAAIRSFEQALAEDPGFALAESALADSQLELMNYDDAPSAVLQARMREYAEKAVQLGPDVAEAHASLAAVLQTAWDYRGAEESYKTALRLNPRFSRAHRWYGGMLLQFGRFDDAFAEVGKAAELDPYDFAGQAFTGRYLYWARRYREALDLEEKALSQKDLVPAHETEGDVYCQLGYHSSGAASAEYFARALQQADYVEQVLRRSAAQAREPSASLWYSDRMHAEYYALSGRPEAARPYVERLATDVAAHGTSPVQLAVVYGMLGERDAAMDLLEKAAESKDRALMYVKVSPEFDPLRNLDRFQALLRKMKL